MRTTRMIVSALFALCSTATGAQAPASTPPPASALPTNPGYLASNCANCHGTTGISKGATPSLAGQKKDFIVEQMKAFRDGKRPSTIMGQLAKGYTDAQIEMVAEYFARQTPAR